MNRRLLLLSLSAKTTPDRRFNPSAINIFRSFILMLLAGLSVVLTGSQVWADIAFVKTIGTASGASTGTTLTVTVPASGIAAGSSIIVSISLREQSRALILQPVQNLFSSCPFLFRILSAAWRKMFFNVPRPVENSLGSDIASARQNIASTHNGDGE